MDRILELCDLKWEKYYIFIVTSLYLKFIHLSCEYWKQITGVLAIPVAYDTIIKESWNIIHTYHSFKIIVHTGRLLSFVFLCVNKELLYEHVTNGVT